MGKPLRVLIIEDSEDDTLLLLRELKHGGYEVEFERVEAAEEMQLALNQKNWDLILSDYSMPTFNALQALELLKASGLDLPFIISSGTIGEETAVAALKAGANDFLVKGKFARLVPAIERELREAESRRERRRAEAQLRYQAYLLSNVNDAIMASDENYRVTFWNHAAEVLYGWSAQEAIGKLGPDITQTEFPQADSDEMRRHIRDTGFWRGEVTQVKKDGTRFHCEISSFLLPAEKGGIAGYVSVNRDITERKRAEEALLASELRYRRLFEAAKDGILILNADTGEIVDVNPFLIEMVGYSHPEFLDKQLWEIGFFKDIFANKAAFLKLQQERYIRYENLPLETKDGRRIWVEFVSNAYDVNGKQVIQCNIRDITERKQAEEQIQLQLQRLKALRAIDIAISSSFNLGLTLDILLDQVITQLNVDAASILLFDSIARGLEHGASRGFRTTAIRGARVRLGEGYAGKAILERRIIHIPNLMETSDELPPAFLLMLKEEGFVDYYGVPLIVKGEAKGVLEIFQRGTLAGGLEWSDFLETLAGQAAIAIEDSTLFENLQRSNQELFHAYDATIEGWSHALDLRDKETEGHTQRVTALTVELASKFGFTEEQLIHVRWGALLHDIGKMGVPDSILLKPDTLTDEEWEIMRRHPMFAFEMLSPIPYLKSSLDIPYCHHEKWDGTGYPRGLKGEVIPVSARLFAVVDVWDALRSDRPYRKGWSAEKTIEYIRSQAGSHFDPKAVELFLQVVNGKSHE